LTLPPELSIEEYPLKDRPPVDESRSFTPVQGTQEEILSKRQSERTKIWRYADQVLLGSDKLTAATADANAGKVSVQVSRNGTAIYTVQLGDSSPIAPIRGLWAYDNHWVLEAAHTIQKFSLSNVIDYNVWGEVVQDGVSLNRQHGYQETFGFQLMKDKPFYFFKKRGQLGISYNRQEIALGYTQVPHYWCCSAAALNPRNAENMVAFFAQRGGVWYYVEIGVFE
jgi:hypothetical protein